MGRFLNLLKEVEEYNRMEYPKIGEPFDTIAAQPPKKGKPVVFERRVQPHIIDSESTGYFLNYWADTIERGYEIAMQKVAELKRNKKLSRKI